MGLISRVSSRTYRNIMADDPVLSNLAQTPINTTKYMTECADYVRQHNIQQLLKDCIYKLCVEKPDDPVEFIHKHFEQLRQVSDRNSLSSTLQSTTKLNKKSTTSTSLSHTINSPTDDISSSALRLPNNNNSGSNAGAGDNNSSISDLNTNNRRTSAESEAMSDGSNGTGVNRHLLNQRRRGAVSAEVYTEEDAKN